MGRLIHYSDKPLTGVYSVAQDQTRAMGLLKPCGLWFSVEGDDDWPHWCEAEGFGAPLDCPTEIILASDANVLRLSTAVDLDRFTEEYGYSPFAGKEDVPESVLREMLYVRWEQVAQKYQGIIIAPYVHVRRLVHHCTWYYTWDCASGCIWDAAAIAELIYPVQALAA